MKHFLKTETFKEKLQNPNIQYRIEEEKDRIPNQRTKYSGR